MDPNQTGWTNLPLSEGVGLGDERRTQEQINAYLARGRYLHSEFTVQLLAALWQKLKIGLMRTVRAAGSAAGKLRGSDGVCNNDASAQQKPGVICELQRLCISCDCSGTRKAIGD